MKILVIDNYDSFVYTLNGYLRQLGAETTVVRNDVYTAEELERAMDRYDAVLVSPGPGNPEQAGMSIDAVRIAARRHVPLLGVCLGHQSIAEAFGATVSSAPELMHGKTSIVHHADATFFEDVRQDFRATRYHSLAVEADTLPDEIEVTAATASGIVMALQHRTEPIYGVQFHPESVLTEDGYRMLGNWLAMAGLESAKARSRELSPLMTEDDAA